jgi:hypothetical protein
VGTTHEERVCETIEHLDSIQSAFDEAFWLVLDNLDSHEPSAKADDIFCHRGKVAFISIITQSDALKV